MNRPSIGINASSPEWRSDRQAAAVLLENGARFDTVNNLFTETFPGVNTPAELLRLAVSENKAKTVLRQRERHWELQQIPLGEGALLFLLRDISPEIALLQKLKDRLNELTTAEHLYKEILEDLPVGVMAVEGNFDAIYANGALKRLFHIPARASLKKCYNYVREIKPCKNCAIECLKSGQTSCKKVYETSETFITAEAHALENKYIITFRDTTREIHLIRQIREQQENLEKAHRMLAEQNDILKRLSNINIRIAQLTNLEEILGEVMISIMETFISPRGAIVLYNRAGQIENARFAGDMTDNERELIISHITAPSDALHRQYPGYLTSDMSREGHAVGKIFLHQPAKAVDPSTLELFLMQVLIFLENLKLQRRLEEIAQTDSLTGVFNRYWFDRQFKLEKEQSVRFHQPMALVVADVNGLKETNDCLGHEAGDRLIRETSALIAAQVGEFARLFRVGGDEFIILLPNCDDEQLAAILQRLRTSQENISFARGEHNVPIRFSIGGACSASTPPDLLKETADKRMYQDKESFYHHHKRYR